MRPSQELHHDISNEALEQRFDELGISRRKLYPLWYRAYRALGVRLRPPVLLTPSEHMVFGWVMFTITYFIAVTVVTWAWERPDLENHNLLFFLLVVGPFLNWVRFSLIRRRLDLGTLSRRA